MAPSANPADLLEGLDLPDGWRVTERIPRSPHASGGNFSVPYKVERDDGPTRVAFLKALDFSQADEMNMPIADALQHLTSAYMFERDLVMDCRRMRNVVQALSAGEITVDDPRVDTMLATVPYIIFEQADSDLRQTVAQKLELFDEAWAFRVLHGVANGLRQLHENGISHQDVKPSNIMTFGQVAKVGDLGRSIRADRPGLYDDLAIVGDLRYAPPELLYGEVDPDAGVRRRACDAYHLGSLAMFLFMGAGMTSLIHGDLDSTFNWRTWPRDYRNALPYVRDAFDRIMEQLAAALPARISEDVVTVVSQLCDPDPFVRGNPARGAGTGRYAMDRYVTHFNRLARRAELELIRPIA